MNCSASQLRAKDGWRNCNLRQTFKKIVKRAGLVVWPRLFSNLRSSRQTELDERFPTHVGCAWLGNSEGIAKRRYLQVTPEHFESAVKKPKEEVPGGNPKHVRSAYRSSERPRWNAWLRNLWAMAT